MTDQILLKIQYNNQFIDYYSIDIRLKYVLKKFKVDYQIEQNIVALQNNVIQDSNTFISQIKGQIYINTLNQVIEDYNKIVQLFINNGLGNSMNSTYHTVQNQSQFNKSGDQDTIKQQYKYNLQIFLEKINQADTDLAQLIQEYKQFKDTQNSKIQKQQEQFNHQIYELQIQLDASQANYQQQQDQLNQQIETNNMLQKQIDIHEENESYWEIQRSEQQQGAQEYMNILGITNEQSQIIEMLQKKIFNLEDDQQNQLQSFLKEKNQLEDLLHNQKQNFNKEKELLDEQISENQIQLFNSEIIENRQIQIIQKLQENLSQLKHDKQQQQNQKKTLNDKELELENLKQQQKKELDSYISKIDVLEDNYEFLKIQLNDSNNELYEQEIKYKAMIQTLKENFRIKKKEYKCKIQNLKLQHNQQQSQLQFILNDKLQEIEKLQDLFGEQQFNYKANQEIQEEKFNTVVNQSKNIEQKLANDVNQLKEEIIKIKNDEKIQIDRLIQINKEEKKHFEAQILQKISEINQLKQYVEKLNQHAQKQEEGLEAKLNHLKEVQNNLKQVEEKQLKLEQDQQNIINQQKLREKEEEQKIFNNQKISEFKKLYNQAQQTHGSIDICFVIDCTQSMDPHKENAIRCIDQTIQTIKQLTNRDCNWAAVAYRDFDFLYSTNNQFYPQLDFTKDPNIIRHFLQQQVCQWGDDLPEDLQGGLRQAAGLGWKSVYRVVMIITDAPCHGFRYHNIPDSYPNSLIEYELEALIHQSIYLICITLPSGQKQEEQIYTQQMFQYFQQYYQARACQDRIEIMEYSQQYNQNMFQRFSYLFKKAAEALTKVSDKNTFRNQKNLSVKLNRQSLVQTINKIVSNPSQLDGLLKIKCKFAVHRQEFNGGSLERNLKTIWNLGTMKFDYKYERQDFSWDCIRSEESFAEGSMKKAYLMKRIDNEELYVIKSPVQGKPYQSYRETLRDCKSHLVARIFLQKFLNICQENKIKKNSKVTIPELQYSEILILEDKQRSEFWIAEKFIKGDFIKYNNNNGYILNQNSNQNHFAQAFSIYSYYYSYFTLMICDLQGVYPYFTDPAINTIRGNFDLTDIGQHGINNYLVNSKGKGLGKMFLDLLDIEIMIQ